MMANFQTRSLQVGVDAVDGQSEINIFDTQPDQFKGRSYKLGTSKCFHALIIIIIVFSSYTIYHYYDLLFFSVPMKGFCHSENYSPGERCSTGVNVIQRLAKQLMAKGIIKNHKQLYAFSATFLLSSRNQYLLDYKSISATDHGGLDTIIFQTEGQSNDFFPQ